MTKLLAHLLKWKYQPGLRGSRWIWTIFDQRRELADILETSPILREYFRPQVSARYLSRAFGLFLEQCPFMADQVLDLDFLPEDRSIE
jgi:hypothetical protein